MVTDVGQLPVIEVDERFETVSNTLNDACVELTALLGHIIVDTDLDDRCPEKVEQLQNLSQQLGLIAGQIEAIGEAICG